MKVASQVVVALSSHVPVCLFAAETVTGNRREHGC